VPDAPAALDAFLRDPRVAGATSSVSVWVEGRGEIAGVNQDLPLIPASNQKLVTAMGALALLDPDERLHTDLVATGPVVDGVLDGDLVLVGGGDPTVVRVGFNSIDALAQEVQRAGITRITGRLVMDESRYDTVRVGGNWPGDWPYSIGPLSALPVDANMYRKDPGFWTDPALGNAEVLRFALTARSIPVDGGVAVGTVEPGMLVGRLESPTVRELVTLLLLRSDNLVGELLVKEIGYRTGAGPGTTAGGLAAIRRVLEGMCVPVDGTDADGSGLSRDNRRSARELRRLLQVAVLQPWGPTFLDTVSLAGAPGALGGRLAKPPTGGNVRAKTGSLGVSRALTGYFTTASGHRGVVSVLVNGSNLNRAESAIDELVTRLVDLRV
jgi:D-alanyl-D-alanine carboxypeptidase/D-alanyl-D-alanine-endopeptidase (penicillin-binding protein 4)